MTLLTNYLTVITNVLRLEVGERIGHDWSGDPGTSPKTQWKLGLEGHGGWKEWKPILEGRTMRAQMQRCGRANVPGSNREQ